MANDNETAAILKVMQAWRDVDFVLEIPASWGKEQTAAFHKAVDAMEESIKQLEYAIGLAEPPHQTDCICADCSGAELTADND